MMVMYDASVPRRLPREPKAPGEAPVRQHTPNATQVIRGQQGSLTDKSQANAVQQSLDKKQTGKEGSVASFMEQASTLPYDPWQDTGLTAGQQDTKYTALSPKPYDPWTDPALTPGGGMTMSAQSAGAPGASAGGATGPGVAAGEIPPLAPEPPQGTAAGSRPGTAQGDLVFSHYDANGQPVYSQAEKTRAVQPGDPARPDMVAARVAEYNNANSRWHGSITGADVSAFDTYAASYKQRTGRTPEIWDWLAAGRPTTTNDYYDDKAVEYNSYDTPYKGTISREDVVAHVQYNREAEAMGLPGMRPEEWFFAGAPPHPHREGARAGAPPDMTGAWRVERPAKPGSSPASSGTPPPGAVPPPAGGTPPLSGVPPPGPPQPVPPPAPVPPPGSSAEDKALAAFQQQLAMQKQKGSAELARNITASAAFDGSTQSGAFAPAVSGAIADYSRDFDTMAADKTLAATMAGEDRALQKALEASRSQTQLGLGGMGLEGTKYSADIQKLIAEGKNATDIQMSQLQAKTQAEVAASNARASAAAAGASAAAQQAAADSAYKSTLAQIEQRDRESLLQYNLGVLGINRDVYGIDTASRDRNLQLLFDMSPDALAKYLLGNLQPNGPIFIQP